MIKLATSTHLELNTNYQDNANKFYENYIQTVRKNND